MKRVYVAGPLSVGSESNNVRDAMLAGHRLIEAGHAPYVPHLSWFMHLLKPQNPEYEVWLPIDFKWLEVCDALVRLPGKSYGAGREVKFAREHGILVFCSVEAFLAHMEGENG